MLATDEQDLKATYAHELESGAIKAKARVAESLYRKATGEGREAVSSDFLAEDQGALEGDLHP
ncbi:hypothetical protein [Mesorhizobium sp.]|uniref:hypothetical protein n=1 Tax=Mesorhizobium sp. TaxID=1871066 RepID=UPI00120859C1|nr:hypothetical protein [Mesorhizobium sp.]TIM04165.1 MAG: hypothetical protein E5Y62_32915 [Mesorhizobium sp.]